MGDNVGFLNKDMVGESVDFLVGEAVRANDGDVVGLLVGD